ncbi:MAG: 3-isopropylmalate dehydratase small subunit, partial [Bacteroidales bacterium]|nr:3-isopropylmalate dehydratase small subunit [Bacteroidales bacterium]MBN2634594.1 3-isopropylmalate dehydratase small subunit [Bacteroidales bacterium]
MEKKKFEIVESTCVPLPFENIDTDQIIPARFLSATSRAGFGENLFRDWRYDKAGTLNPDFVLNNPQFSGEILVAKRNFGCGSSREHAVWAISDYGFRAVVSSYFADIFKNNALNNGLLPVTVPESYLGNLLEMIHRDPSVTVRIDLINETISVPSVGISVRFEVNPYKKE